jgi:hypothetical protein
MLRVKVTENRSRSTVKQLIVPAALIGLVMLPRVLHLSTFIGPDEKAIWGWGNRFALVIASGRWQETLIGDGYPAVTVMWIHTMGIGLKWLWLQLWGAGLPWEEVIGLDRPVELYAERRLFLSLVNGLQVLAAYPLLRKLWDGRIAALAVGLMAVEPLYLAFARMIRADALLAGFMLLSILAALVFLKTGERRYNRLSGACAGLAALSKFSGGILALEIVFVYAVFAWLSVRKSQRRNRHTLRWWIGAVLGWGVSAAILFFGMWPAWWFQPAATFNLLLGKVVYHAVDAATLRADTYFWGSVRPFGPGLWFYPVLAVFRLTPWLLVGSGMVLAGWLWRITRRRSAAWDWSALAIGFCVAAYWLAISLPGQKFDRYFVPVIPGLAVLAALALAGAARWFSRRMLSRFGPSHPWPGFAFTALGLLMTGYVATYHPLYSTYFSPLAGSSRFAQWALPVGNGEGVDEALKYLAALPRAGDSILLCGTNHPRCEPFFNGDVWHQEDLRSDRWFEADYVLWHVDEEQMRVFPEGVLAYLRRQPPIYVARHHGIDYAWLYAVPQPAFLTGGSKLEGVATLLGYEIIPGDLSSISPGDRLDAHLYWQNEGQALAQRFWWRVVDGAGYTWSEAVARPLPDFESEAAQDGAVVESEVMMHFPPDMPPGLYYLKTGFADGRGDTGQFTLPEEGSVLAVGGPSSGATPPDRTLEETVTPDIHLRGYDLPGTEFVPDEALWLTLHWETAGEPQGDYVVTVHLLNDAAEELAAWSGRPVHGTYPTNQWPANSSVRDPRQLVLPPGLPPGLYRLELGLQEATRSTELARIDLGRMHIVERRVDFDAPSMQYQAETSFDEVARLLGYDLLGDLSPDSAHVRVTLYWRVLEATDQPHRVNVRLVDSNGLVLAEHESEPADGAAPTTKWRAGEVIEDIHELEIAGGEPSPVNLELRLLDAAGSSLPTEDGAGVVIIPDAHQKVMWRVPPQ